MTGYSRLFSFGLVATGLSALLLVGGGRDAWADTFFASGAYEVKLRGIHVAEAEIGFTDDGNRYRVAINGSVAGLAQLVASGTATLSSAGRSRPDRLVSDNFALNTLTDTEAFSLSFEARNGNVTSDRVNPPLPPDMERVPVQQSHRRGVNDPIAAFLVKADSLDASVCDRKLSIYTGLERYDMHLSFVEHQTATSSRTGYQGPVVLCNIRYKPISGHFTNSESTEYLANSDRFLVWYAPLGETGYMIPYRMIMGTAFGDLSLVLTELSGV